MQVFLENEQVKVTINKFGAELSGMMKKTTGVEYVWNADAAYWKRSAPVLFPIVGSLKNKEYKYEGKSYSMGQHGFARDMEFEVVSGNNEEAWFVLKSNAETMEKYPFAFKLEIGYKLQESRLTVIWRVTNEGDKNMHFSIGGHPAFMCPLNGEGKQSDYYISFDTEQQLNYSLLNADGLLKQESLILDTNGGMMPIDEHLFDQDALIMEGNQAHEISLCNSDKKPYLTVKFDAPLFGLWSPAGKGAPFICIEPWYGRCDKESFSDELSEREYNNSLKAGEVFERSFSIEVFDI